MPITSSSVFVVSGGARGITAQCVIRMAHHYRCKFLLLGRSALTPEPAYAAGITDDAALKQRIVDDLRAQGEKPLPRTVQQRANAITAAREIAATLRAIEAAGGSAEYASVDVTDSADVLRVTADAARRLGPFTGIMHGAGVLADRRIEHKSADDFERVYGVKVHGLENLLAAVPEPQHVILFSSVAGFAGNIGQADYALANDILNKAAYQVRQRIPGCHVVAINWGPWDAGMVTPALKAYFEQHGIATIPLETGTAMLIDELERGAHDADAPPQIVIGSTFDAVREPDATLHTYRLERTLRRAESPMLADHVVNHQAVLPMVCAMSWMGNAAEQLYPGYHFASYTGYKVLKGIVFDETLADRYTLELAETRKDAGAGEIAFDALIRSATAEGKPRYHYRAQLLLRRELPPAPTFDRMDLTNRDDIPGERLYAEKILFHGWSFKGVQRVLNTSTERTTMRCHLPHIPAEYQGQFPVQSFNYFGVDAALQSLGTFARLGYGMGSLPLSAEGGAAFRDIPFGADFYVTLEPRDITEAKILGDLTIHDDAGLVYFRVTGCQIALSERLIELFERNTLLEEVH